MILSRDFYSRDPMTVAQELVGCYLCRRMPDGAVVRARICELELYTQDERACHAFGARTTSRNDAMFMPGGHAYVYLCYGLHNMLNIVVGPSGYAAAVLIRALEAEGCNGPGKLTRRLSITRVDNKMDLCSGAGAIWLEVRDSKPHITACTRIGVDYAGADAARPWRFVITGCPYVSRMP